MPKTVTIVKNPNYEIKHGDKAIYDAIKPKVVSYQTALENIRLSKGMYMISTAKPEPAASTAPRLEDMDLADLKVLMLQTGIKTEKQLTRSQVITLIRKKLEAVDLVEDQE